MREIAAFGLLNGQNCLTNKLSIAKKFVYRSSREFMVSLDRLLASDWIGVFGAHWLVDFVREHKDKQ